MISRGMWEKGWRRKGERVSDLRGLGISVFNSGAGEATKTHAADTGESLACVRVPGREVARTWRKSLVCGSEARRAGHRGRAKVGRAVQGACD